MKWVLLVYLSIYPNKLHTSVDFNTERACRAIEAEMRSTAEALRQAATDKAGTAQTRHAASQLFAETTIGKCVSKD